MLLIPLLILIFFLGLEITIILGVDVPLPERLSVSFLLGIGILTFALFLLAFGFNLNFGLVNTFSVLIILCVLAFILRCKEIIFFFRSIQIKKAAIRPKIAFFWGLILAAFAFTLLVNLYWPIADWDAIALYDFRARIFLVDTNLIHAALSNTYFMGYPFLTSLAHLFVYQAGLNNPKFFYSLFYLSFIVIFFYSLKSNVGENKAIVFTLVLSLVPEIFTHAMMAYTNLGYLVYLCAGTFYLYSWIQKREPSYLFLSAILVGLSSWVRSAESFWLVPIFVMFLISLRYKRWMYFAYYLIIVLTFVLPWDKFMGYINSLAMPASGGAALNYLELLKSISLERVISVASFLYTYVFSTWGFIFAAFILTIIMAIFNCKTKNNLFLGITLLFFVFLYAGTLIFSITFPGWQDIPDSARRLGMFLLPLMIYAVSLQT